MPSPISRGSKKGASLPCKRYAVGGTSSVGVLAKSSAKISTRALRPEVPSSLRKYCTSSEKRTTYPFVRDRIILPVVGVEEESMASGLYTRSQTPNGGTTMLKKVVYVALLVSDQDKALDFYTNVIGLEKRGEYPTPDDGP